MTTTYYGNVNPDLLGWTPLSARRVLEVGCGEGAFAVAYKARNPTVEYVAVESHGPAAAVARGRVDRLIEGSFTDMPPDEVASLGLFDALVLGDVLEHLPDPWQALEKLDKVIGPGGRLCLSVPNVGHWTALANLMMGHWPAQDSGLFDRTHIRWFTLASLTEILSDKRFEVERIRPRKYLLNDAAARQWIPLMASIVEQVGQDRAGFISRAETLQYVLTARPARVAAREKLHLQVAALAPRFLDVRTRLPVEALRSDPELVVGYQEQSLTLPDVPADRLKVMVLQRPGSIEDEAWRQYLARAEAAGWVLVLEMDDHPSLIARVHSRTVDDSVWDLMRRVHAVQTSTPALRDVFREQNPEVALFENAVLELPPFRPRGPARKVFYGALNREAFSRGVAADLAAAVQAVPELEFSVVHDRAFFEALPTGNKRFQEALGYDAYLQAMGEADVVLSPLAGTGGEAFKSDVKFLEAASAGAAMIASPSVYEHTIRDGETGLLAHAPEQWSSHLIHLARDPEARDRIAQAAWSYVARERMLATQVSARHNWYRSLCERRGELASALKARWPSSQAAG